MSTDRDCPKCGGATELRRGEGQTCGGLALDRWRWCEACQRAWVPAKADLRRPLPVLELPPAAYENAPSSRAGKRGQTRLALDGPVAPVADLVPAGPWHVADSGVSLDAGHIRVRFDGGTFEERQALAAAIALVPLVLCRPQVPA